MKKIFLSSIISLIALVSCKKSEENPDVTIGITGTYKMSTLETEKGEVTKGVTDNRIVVSKVENNKVSVYVDFAPGNGDDIFLPAMKVDKVDFNHKINQSFTNATATGNVSASVLTLSVIYTAKTDSVIAPGDYVNIFAIK